mgnify:CR=1 FL=1
MVPDSDGDDDTQRPRSPGGGEPSEARRDTSELFSDGGEPSETRRTSSELCSDGGTDPGFDEARLYNVVRAAMKDALLDVIGTLLLVGLSFVLVAMGGQILLQADAVTSGAVGGVLVLVGLYIAAATLELIPPIREWV